MGFIFCADFFCHSGAQNSPTTPSFPEMRAEIDECYRKMHAADYADPNDAQLAAMGAAHREPPLPRQHVQEGGPNEES